MAASTTTTGGLPERQHLEGSSNYNDWKFAMRMFLIDAGLWEPVNMDAADEDFNSSKDQRALAKICLSVKPSAYAHVRNENTSKAAWTKLQQAYEDSGLSRRLGLLSSLMAIRFSSFNSMEEYVNKIMATSQQLKDVNKPVDDELIGALMLAGLPKEFKPLILGLEGSGKEITSELIKSLLLQEDVRKEFDNGNNSGESVYATGKNKFFNYNNKNWKYFKDGNKPKKQFEKLNDPVFKTEKPNFKKNNNNRFAFHIALAARSDQDQWYVDSGAAKHLTSRQDWLENFQNNKQPDIVVANNERLECQGKGNVTLPVYVNNETNYVTAYDVTLAPGLSTNLLSVSQMVKKDLTVVFNKCGGFIVQGNISLTDLNVIGTATEESGMYRLDQTPIMACSAMTTSSGDLWHRRLRHLNRVSMRLLKNKMATGIQYESDLAEPCVDCVKGKQHREPFPKTKGKRAKQKLALVHSDVRGPMSTPSVGGARYFVTFNDDLTRKSFVYFLHNKHEVTDKFKEFKSMAENMTGFRIITLRTDNGTEYVNAELRQFLKENGIQHQLTVAYSPEQNGVAERLNRTIVEKGC